MTATTTAAPSAGERDALIIALNDAKLTVHAGNASVTVYELGDRIKRAGYDRAAADLLSGYADAVSHAAATRVQAAALPLGRIAADALGAAAARLFRSA